MEGPGRTTESIESGLSRRRFLRLASGAVASGLGASLLAACAQPSTHHHAVNIMDVGHFVPGSISIPVGDSIVWNNKDTLPHTATCDPSKANKASNVQLPNGAQAWNSGPIKPGQTWAHTFDTAGTFVYFSINDENDGYVGTIVVTS